MERPDALLEFHLAQFTHTQQVEAARLDYQKVSDERAERMINRLVDVAVAAFARIVDLEEKKSGNRLAALTREAEVNSKKAEVDMKREEVKELEIRQRISNGSSGRHTNA